MNETLDPHIDELYSQLKDAVIMMVDDEPLLMEVLQAFLEEEGYHNFIKVEDSRKAIDMLQSERPDILLLDLKMPHVDGFQILEAVRGGEDIDRMPIIVLTSSTDAETKLRALELGATDFLAKPVDASEMVLRLRNTLTVKAYQDQLTYYDSLTHLPNRKLFIDRLEWLLKKARRESGRVAVLDIGLDRFKQINDSLGPAVGDEVLKQVASRMLASVRETDVLTRVGARDLWRQLARLSGDEFSILLPGVKPANSAAFVARRIQEAIAEKIVVADNEIYLSASVGIAIYPEDGMEADRLIKNAGAATAFAKQQGRENCEFYSKEINAHSRRRLSIEAELRRALAEDQFVLHYQPKLDAQSGVVKGCESLLRWRREDDSLMMPGDFIPVAEECGLIVPMGEWVIREACRQQVAWSAGAVGDLVVSVNVAGPQFHKDSLSAFIRSTLDSVAMDPKRLTLEITESMLMGDADGLIRKLHKIRSYGPTFSIDDFGTGYSSLSYLKRFPIDELKIDRSFIIEVPAARDDGAIVRAIIAMAHSLDLTVVAEGVEHVGQLEYLKSLQCDLIQGFYFSRPLPADEFANYVVTSRQSGVAQLG